MARSTSRTKKKTPSERKKCPKCERELALSNFYAATEVLYPDKKFFLCKACIEIIIDSQGFTGFMMILRAMNKPFLSDIFTGDYKSFIRQINSLPQYKGMTYDDSSNDNLKNVELKLNNKDDVKESEVDFTPEELRELADFWGRGYTKEEYEFLSNEYHRLLTSYECDSYAMELLFQEAAQQRLTIKKRREKGDSVDKELKTLQDLLGSANIKPAQETGANAVEQATFGTLVKKYENERPIPEPDEQWKDVDGIRKYVNVWFLGHLCKMLGVRNEYSELYEQEVNKYRVEAPKFEDEEGVS